MREIKLRTLESAIAYDGIPTLWDEIKFAIGAAFAVAKEIIGL